MTRHIHVPSRSDASLLVASLLPCPVVESPEKTARAGYPVFVPAEDFADAYFLWVDDLGDRYELNMPDGLTINIWIDEERNPAARATSMPFDKEELSTLLAGLFLARDYEMERLNTFNDGSKDPFEMAKSAAMLARTMTLVKKINELLESK